MTKSFILEMNRKATRSWPVWIVDNHYDFVVHSRTETGDLVSSSKYRFDEQSCRKLLEIVSNAAKWAAEMPRRHGLVAVDAIMAVPYFGDKQLSVPHRMAQTISAVLGVPDCSNQVQKVKQTEPAKTTPGALNPDAYRANLSSAMERVLLVDDLYSTGATLESVALCLREAGVHDFVGFCATKVVYGMRGQSDDG